MRKLILLLIVATLLFTAVPAKAIWDTGSCINAAYYKWQNIGANLAYFASIILNDGMVDWESGNVGGDVL